ncbi:hypothetical protein [Nonomuraea jabiensis]|uniref:Uncharacterized protein n=1 Tax=Nonomuraea jabiensis TaxID=882448 RepID=A0A7W9LFP5_9ACTN|nr:hypothetical protein [Nonomuraea jabiensis]MBB5782081.1 hypothetical protein [Nonomuraea jabiensis]
MIVGRESKPDVDVKTTALSYDWATGRQIRTVRDPGGRAVTTDTAGPVLHTATGSGTCGGRPEWAGLVCQDGGKTYTYTASGLPDTVTEGTRSPRSSATRPAAPSRPGPAARPRSASATARPPAGPPSGGAARRRS